MCGFMKYLKRAIFSFTERKRACYSSQRLTWIDEYKSTIRICTLSEQRQCYQIDIDRYQDGIKLTR